MIDCSRSVLEKVNKYADLVKDILPVKMVILYGSYAKNTAGKNSDIDVAVVVDDFNESYLDTSAKLYKLVREVDIDIEPVLLDKQMDKSGFLESIMKYGKVIYENN